MFITQLQECQKFEPYIEYCMTPEIYDKNTLIVGFSEPTITSANKNSFVSHSKYPDIKKGMNVIVMGDMLDDIRIIEELECSTIIRGGFYNSTPVESDPEFRKYLETFDIVLANDGNLVHIAELIKLIARLPNDPKYKSYGPSAKLFAKFLNK